MTITPLSPIEDSDDATLATAAARGDRIAFAAIYDRYANRLHDFCVGMLRDRDSAADCVQDVFVTAASRLCQLREPERLKTWLYAIARNEALARIRARRRERPSDELPETISEEPDLATLAARSELADLISDACGGLSDRDQLVLELSYRQGLDGPELADALGVSHKNANTLVERLRATVARSLGALLVCRQVRANPNLCPELAALIEHWDGRFTVLMRKRAARHIDDCPNCVVERDRMVTPTALLGSAPLLVPAPAWLRGHTLNQATAALPPPAPLPSSDAESWWPPNDLDTKDLGSRFMRRHLPGIAVTGVLAAAAVAAVLLAAPSIHRVEQISNPGELATRTSSPAKVAPATAGILSPPSPRTAAPAGPHNAVSPGPTGPTAPPGATSGPVVSPGTPQGPTSATAGPIVLPNPPKESAPPPVIVSAGPIIPPSPPQESAPPPVTFTAGPIVSSPSKKPDPPKGGIVVNPGRLPPGELNGGGDCVPPQCQPPVGPLQ